MRVKRSSKARRLIDLLCACAYLFGIRDKRIQCHGLDDQLRQRRQRYSGRTTHEVVVAWEDNIAYVEDAHVLALHIPPWITKARNRIQFAFRARDREQTPWNILAAPARYTFLGLGCS